MRYSNKIGPLGAIVCLAACSSIQTASPQSGEDRQFDATHTMQKPEGWRTSIDRIIDDARAEGFAGQVVIARKGKIAYQRSAGFSDLAGTIPVNTETVFGTASIMKYFTAALILREQDKGKLNINDPIGEWVPGTRLAEDRVTFEELLSHRSGLDSTYALEQESDQARALEAIDNESQDRGNYRGKFRYSNDGYAVLAIILERIHERPYEEIVRSEILDLAGLSGVKLIDDVNASDPKQVGQPYEPIEPHLLQRNYGMLGNDGLWISASQLVRWQLALRSGRILSEESLAAMREPRIKVSIGQGAFGSFVVDTVAGKAWRALGSNDWGDNASLSDYSDCDLIVAIVTSRGPMEDTDEPLFRTFIAEKIEEVLAPECRRT